MSNQTTETDEQSTYLLDTLIHLPIVAGRDVSVDKDEVALGKITDMVARFDEEGYPPITGLLMISHGSEFFIPIRYVSEVKTDKIGLVSGSPKTYEPFLRRPKEALLARDILNHKLIHISKQHHPSLIKADNLEITFVDNGWALTSIIQLRQGKLKSLLRKKQSEEEPHHKIDFLNVEPFMNHVPTSKLKLRHKKLAEIHPSELADLVEAATPAESDEILDAVGEDEALEADVIEELTDDHQLHIVSKRSNEEIAELLSNMEPDDAVDLISELTQDRRDPVLKLVPFKKQQALRKLLGYNSETAGGLMNSETMQISVDLTVADLILKLKDSKLSPTLLDTIFVVTDDEQLIGFLRIAEIIKLNPADKIGEIAHRDMPTIPTGGDFTEIVMIMSDYNLYSIAVVDQDNRLVGAITVDDILEKLVPENWRKRSMIDRS